MSADSQTSVMVRKARTGVSLAARVLIKANARSRNLLRKWSRHYTKRIRWRWKVARRGVEHAGIATWNIGRLIVRRLLSLHKPFVRLSRRTRRSGELLALRRNEWSVERQTRRTARSRRPLVLGPWVSEVGFEVLYWIPFLRWLRAECGWDPSTAVAISRGGVASWYGDVAERYVEIFDVVDLHTFNVRNARRASADGTQKQLDRSDFDRDLILQACEKAGLTGHRVVHPSAMYRLFRQFWLGHRPVSHVLERTRFARLCPPAGSDRHMLPAEYVAVKIYTAKSLPDLPRHRKFICALVDHLTESVPVVILDTGFTIADHEDYRLERRDRVFHLDTRMNLQNNLELQTQVIAGARAFVGTCGSLTWMAPMLGVPTVALFGDDRFLREHLYFARHAYSAMGAASFATVDVNALDAPRIDLASLLATGPVLTRVEVPR